MVAADVVCLTSQSEALPMMLMEAMALGRPIIATDVGGTRDLIVSGETGVLIPPNDEDALVTLGSSGTTRAAGGVRSVRAPAAAGPLHARAHGVGVR